MTKDEKKHLSRLAEFGCCVCRREGFGVSPAEIHHIRATAGMGQRSSHFDAIPLCPLHHRLGGHGVALHAGQKTFERRYGTETELLEWVRHALHTE